MASRIFVVYVNSKNPKLSVYLDTNSKVVKRMYVMKLLEASMRAKFQTHILIVDCATGKRVSNIDDVIFEILFGIYRCSI